MDKVEFYRDAKDEWRWHRKDEGNHSILSTSGEGFVQYRSAYDNAYSQFGDTVEYVKWPHDETGDPVAPVLEVEDDGGEAPNEHSEGAE
jgi:hypothetical protein